MSCQPFLVASGAIYLVLFARDSEDVALLLLCLYIAASVISSLLLFLA